MARDWHVRKENGRSVASATVRCMEMRDEPIAVCLITDVKIKKRQIIIVILIFIR